MLLGDGKTGVLRTALRMCRIISRRGGDQSHSSWIMCFVERKHAEYDKCRQILVKLPIYGPGLSNKPNKTETNTYLLRPKHLLCFFHSVHPTDFFSFLFKSLNYPFVPKDQKNRIARVPRLRLLMKATQRVKLVPINVDFISRR